MVDEHAVSALVRKRAEIAGQIEHLQAQLKQAVLDLDNVEATLRIFAPDMDLGEVLPRRVPVAHHAFRGEISRIVLETLRQTQRPLSAVDLAKVVMQERGLDTTNAALVRTMQQRVGACLRHWEKSRGVLRSMPGPGQRKVWQIAG